MSVKTQVLDFFNLAQNANKMSFPFNFTKISNGCHFTVTEPKILKLLPDTNFDTSFQNNILVSLQLLLSCSKFCPVKQNSKFDSL